MSQYDHYENPSITHPLCAYPPSQVSPTNKPLQTCYAEGINKASDTDTPGIQGSSTILSNHSHRRRSSLFRDDHQVDKLVPKVFSEAPVFDDSSLKRLGEDEREQATDIEASQKQDDDVRMMVHSDRRAREKAITQVWECDHTDEHYEKIPVRDSSWMHRSLPSRDLSMQTYKADVGGRQSVNVADFSARRSDHG